MALLVFSDSDNYTKVQSALNSMLKCHAKYVNLSSSMSNHKQCNSFPKMSVRSTFFVVSNAVLKTLSTSLKDFTLKVSPSQAEKCSADQFAQIF